MILIFGFCRQNVADWFEQTTMVEAATAERGGADHCIRRSRGGLTTKFHVVVDAHGLPIRLGLTAGQTHDGQIADRLLDHLGARTIVLADNACDADRIPELIRNQGATPNIPPKSTARHGPMSQHDSYQTRTIKLRDQTSNRARGRT